MSPFPQGHNLPKPPDVTVVFPHLEMGDALITNGMCRTIAANGRKVVWLCDVKYVWDVRKMYKDLPNVQVLGALGYDDIKHRWMPSVPDAKCIGDFSPDTFDVSKWDEAFYHQLGMNFNLRWTAFGLPPSLRLAEPTIKEPQVLIHDDPGRRFNILRALLPKDKKHIVITNRNLFWDWLPEVLASSELHFIDSAFLNLAESLYGLGYLRNTKLVWHKYSRNYSRTGPPMMKAPWFIFQ